MKSDELLSFLKILEQLKCHTRHSWTTSGRQESVAEHSWRLAVLAMLMEEDFPDLDMNRVIRLCLVHDWGEAVTGDIPAFIKTEKDEETETQAIKSLTDRLTGKAGKEAAGLFDEYLAGETKEAKLCVALDKIETLIQHNEAGTDTWLPLEYEMNLVYGDGPASEFEVTKQLKDAVREESRRLVKDAEYLKESGI